MQENINNIIFDSKLTVVETDLFDPFALSEARRAQSNGCERQIKVSVRIRSTTFAVACPEHSRRAHSAQYERMGLP